MKWIFLHVFCTTFVVEIINYVSCAYTVQTWGIRVCSIEYESHCVGIEVWASGSVMCQTTPDEPLAVVSKHTSIPYLKIII